MDSHDQEIQDKFGFGDEWAYSELIKQKRDFKYIKIERPNNKHEQLNDEKSSFVEYMWKNHSLIEVSNVENGKTVVGIGFNPALGSDDFDEEVKYNNPTGKFWEKDGKQIPNKVLEATRSRSIGRVDDYLENEEIKYFIQLDLIVDATKKSSDIDIEKAKKIGIPMLKKAIEKADYVLIAWGASGQKVINNEVLNEELLDILRPLVASQKVIWFGHSEAPRHVLSAPKECTKKMEESDLDRIFSKKDKCEE